MEKFRREKCTVAQAIVKMFIKEGVKDIFGLPGSQVLDLLDAIGSSKELRFLLVREEHAGSFMTNAYSQFSKRPSVLITTLGPGATNAATGIAAAYKAASPVILITGKGHRNLHQRDYFQEIDEYKVLEPITKWSYMVSDPSQIQTVLRKAFRIAQTGRPGPVHLSIPSDIYKEEIIYEDMEPFNYRPNEEERIASDKQVKRFIEILQKSEYPMFVCGREFVWENQENWIMELCERFEIPVATTVNNLDAFPSTHKLGLGAIGKNGWDSANDYMKLADTIIFLGANFDYLTTNFNRELFKNVKNLGHVTSFPEKVGVSMPIDWSMVCSPNSLLKGAINSTKNMKFVNTGRIEIVKEMKERWDLKRKKDSTQVGSILKPQYVARCIRSAMKDDGIAVMDGGNFAKYIRKYFDTYKTHTFLDAYDFGTVGSGFTMALGVQAAAQDRQVVSILGDGAFIMKMSELETAVRENLPVKTVIFNDYGYGNIRTYQKYRYGERYIGCDYNNPDFAEVAKLFGAYGKQVKDEKELPEVLYEAFNYPGPAVVDVIVDPNELGMPVHSNQG